MDGIGKMYNPDSGRGTPAPSFGGRPQQPRYGQALSSTQIPGHTESFYRTLRDTPKEKGNAPVKTEGPLPAEEHKETENKQTPSGGITPSLRFPSLFGGSVGRSFGDGLSSLLKNIGEDDILLILMMILLLNENRQDDWLVLIILGFILLT